MMKIFSIVLFIFYVICLVGCGQLQGDSYANQKELREYTLRAPTSTMTMNLPASFDLNLTPNDTSAPELDEFSSTHGTNLPAQGEYLGKPTDDTRFFFWTSYVSFDIPSIEAKTGTSFTPNLEGSISSYINSMKQKYALTYDVEDSMIGGSNAKLVTIKYNREGNPSIQKAVFIIQNEDLWQIRFICLDDETTRSNELKLIDNIIQDIKLSKSNN